MYIFKIVVWYFSDGGNLVGFRFQLVIFSFMTSISQMCTLVSITLLSAALARGGKTIVGQGKTNLVGSLGTCLLKRRKERK